MKILKYILVSMLIIVNMIVLENTYAESFNNYSSLGGSTSTGRSPNKKVSKSCKTYTCGPTSNIELSMLPSPNVDLKNYNIGGNSTLEQMMKMGEDIEKYGPTAAMGKMGIPQRLGGETKKINITFPMIDYGFSGSFNNILISVTEKKRGGSRRDTRRYKSVVQGLTSKDYNQVEYTGNIKIEKYTRFILKGSYSATLRKYKQIPWEDVRLVGQPDRFCPALTDPSTPACTAYTLEGTGKIEGQFNILSPWRDDDRLNKGIDTKSSFVDPLKNDIKGMVAQFGIDVDVDKEFAKAGFGSGGSSGGSNSSSSFGPSSGKDIYGGCNCSCNFVESATTQCKSSCSAAFSACRGERYKPPTRTAANNKILDSLIPKLPTKLDLPKAKGAKLLGIDQNFVDKLEKGEVKTPTNLRKKFISMLQKSHPGNANAPIRDMMIKGFDSMPDDKAKMIMLKSIEGM